MNRTKKIFTNNLNHLMKIRGISRPKLGADLDIPYPTVVNWTTYQSYPKAKNLDKIANYFNVSNAELMKSKITSKTVPHVDLYGLLRNGKILWQGHPLDHSDKLMIRMWFNNKYRKES